MDQVLALKWIKDNINAFGGDPDLITVFGESSGASSAGLHMMSSYSQDLFQRVIFESGSPDSHWAFMTQQQAKDRSTLYFDAVGCKQDETDELLACLRALDTDTILNNEWVDGNYLVFPWAPSVDGDFLEDSPYNMLQQGRYRKKDSLLGVNKDEGTYWLLYTIGGMSKDHESLLDYNSFVSAIDIVDHDVSTETRRRILEMYAPEDTTDGAANRDSLDKISGDRSFTCPTRQLAEILSEGGAKTYFYYLTHRASNEVWPPWMGVIHGAEIQVHVGQDFGIYCRDAV